MSLSYRTLENKHHIDFYSTEDGGNVKEEGDYKEGTKDGLWTFWSRCGNVTITETYKEGELVE